MIWRKFGDQTHDMNTPAPGSSQYESEGFASQSDIEKLLAAAVGDGPSVAASSSRSLGGEIVSQSEIESLLASVGTRESASLGMSIGRDHPLASVPDGPRVCTFPQVSSFSMSELRRLRIRHEDFVRSLAIRLSAHLRMECQLQMTKLETVAFQNFVDRLSDPTHLTLLRLDPLKGICLVEMPLPLALSFVNRELGGPGEYPDSPRDLTPVEMRLVKRVVQLIISEWCSTWSDKLDLRPELLRSENSGQFLRMHAPDAAILVVGMDAKIGAISGQIQLALAHSTLMPLMNKLNAENATAESNSNEQRSVATKWNPILGNIEIRVTAQMPGLEMTVKDVTKLKPGDMVEIPRNLADKVQVCLEGIPMLQGRLGIMGKHWAVQVLERV